MKRISALFLSLVLLLSLVGCGGSDSGDGSSDSNDKVQFEEMTVIDNDECLLKITEIDLKGTTGCELKAYLENKSADTTYMFAVEEASINNVEVPSLFATEVAPGKQANDTIDLATTTIKNNGLKKFTDIEVTVRVHDSKNWSAPNVAEETFHIYPYGQDKAEKFTRESKDTDTVLVDNDQISVTVTGYDDDGVFGHEVNVYLVNKTDQTLMFSVDDASVNGFMIDPFWATSVAPGKSDFSSISWSDSSLEENKITKIEEIEMVLSVHDANDLFADDIYEETIKLNP